MIRFASAIGLSRRFDSAADLALAAAREIIPGAGPSELTGSALLMLTRHGRNDAAILELGAHDLRRLGAFATRIGRALEGLPTASADTPRGPSTPRDPLLSLVLHLKEIPR